MLVLENEEEEEKEEEKEKGNGEEGPSQFLKRPLRQVAGADKLEHAEYESRQGEQSD